MVWRFSRFLKQFLSCLPFGRWIPWGKKKLIGDLNLVFATTCGIQQLANACKSKRGREEYKSTKVLTGKCFRLVKVQQFLQSFLRLDLEPSELLELLELMNLCTLSYVEIYLPWNTDLYSTGYYLKFPLQQVGLRWWIGSSSPDEALVTGIGVSSSAALTSERRR